MKYAALAVVLCPLFGSVIVGSKKMSERAVSRLSRGILFASTFFASAVIGAWGLAGTTPLEYVLGTLYRHGDYLFRVVFFVDAASCLYLVLTLVLANVMAKYSQYYLHREEGYRRYFALLLLMVSGSNLLALAGSLDLFFAGWEFIGLASFLLIGFYWGRPQPTRNAFVAFIVYRVCDIGLLGATMLAPMLSAEGNHFLGLHASGFAYAFETHPYLTALAAVLLLVAALGKSAQFPFMNYLPRALEGPTPSTAIFYGALSVHAGVFLLLRTQPLWMHYPMMRVLIVACGLASALIGTSIGRTLSNIKGQIAYAAITQVGIMFIELAAGLRDLTLAHLVLHSFLRAYQILISPSIVAHALRVIGSSNALARPVSIAKRVLSRYELAFYRLTLADYYMWPSTSALVFWAPRKLRSVAVRVLPRLGVVYAISLVAISYRVGHVSSGWIARPHPVLALVACLLMLITAAYAQFSGQAAIHAWLKVGVTLGLGFAALVTLDPRDGWSAAMPYYSFSATAWLAGLATMRECGHLLLSRQHGRLAIDRKSGYGLLAVLVVIAAMPLSPAFTGVDVLLHWAFKHSVVGAACIALSLMMTAIAVARIFTKIYLGPQSQQEVRSA